MAGSPLFSDGVRNDGDMAAGSAPAVERVDTPRGIDEVVFAECRGQRGIRLERGDHPREERRFPDVVIVQERLAAKPETMARA